VQPAIFLLKSDGTAEVLEGSVSEQAPRIAFVTNETATAEAAAARLRELYGDAPIEDAEIVVALGGDGLMLQTLHRVMTTDIPVYGMNFGTVGFMMNAYSEDGLEQRLRAAQRTRIYPLSMRVTDSTATRRQRSRSQSMATSASTN
jgi:NAD+ kinase